MRTVNGANGMCVPELKRPQLHLLSEEAWKAERLLVLNSLDESQADSELRLKTLRDNDSHRGTSGPLILVSFKMDWCDRIVRMACGEAKVDAASFIEGLPDREVQRIARELMGFRPLSEGETAAM